MRLFRLSVAILIITHLCLSNLMAQGKSTPVEQRIKQLHTLLSEQWEYTLKSNPEFASILGDRRYNDKLSDNSEAAIAKDLQQARTFLKRFESIDTAGFPEQEQLNRDLMVLNLRDRLDSAKFKDWEMPVTQFGGIHLDTPQLVTALPFTTVKDYDDYIARLKQLPEAFEQITVLMRH